MVHLVEVSPRLSEEQHKDAFVFLTLNMGTWNVCTSWKYTRVLLF